jgi:RecA/RadA recombinase
MSKFLKNLIKKDDEARSLIAARLQGQDVLAFDDPTLQWATGGWSRGRVNLIWGPSGSGKTGIVLKQAAKEMQMVPGDGIVLVFDSEYAHPGALCADEKKAKQRYMQAGLDPDRCHVIQSNKMDELFGDIGTLETEIKNRTLNVAAIIVDSWGGVQSEQAYNKIVEGNVAAAGNAFGGNAKTMGPVLQTLLRIAAENGITMFCVQHCINNMEQYGPKYILIGGQKLRFLVHSSLFVESITAKDASLLSGDQASVNNDFMYRIGKKIRSKCEKSRFVVEGRKAEFWMDFENLRFALPEESLTELALELGVVGKVNNVTYEYPVGAPTPVRFTGRAALTDAIKKDKQLYDAIFASCNQSKKLDTLNMPIGDELGIVNNDEGDEDGANAETLKAKGRKKK